MNPLHPYGGPEPRSDVRELTDDAEVRECRRILDIDYGAPQGGLLYVEQYDSAAELGAARDLEVWGCNPFEDD